MWIASIIPIITICIEDNLELLSTTECNKPIDYNKENQESTWGKVDHTESDYVIHEEPTQSPVLL